MEKKIEKLLDLLIEGIEKGTGAANEQLPLIASDIVQWGIFYPLTWSVFWMGLCAFFFLIVRKCQKALKKEPGDDALEVAGVLSWLASIGSGFIAVGVLISAFQPMIAPKLYLLEYLKGFQ